MNIIIEVLKNTFRASSFKTDGIDIPHLLLIDFGIPAIAIIFVLVSQNHAANYLILFSAATAKLAINTYLNRLEI